MAAFFGPRCIAVTRQDFDLTCQNAVDTFFEGRKFNVVFHCAVRGGSRLASDSADVFYDNVLMFETVAKHAHRFRRLIYFSSGARFDRTVNDKTRIPTDFYGFSKYVIEMRADSIENLFILRIYGCFGRGEPRTRFLSTCVREKHVQIGTDRYFDFFWVEDLLRVVNYYVEKIEEQPPRFVDLVYSTKYKLSDLATLANATYTVASEDLGPPYVGDFNFGFINFDDHECLRRGIAQLAENPEHL